MYREQIIAIFNKALMDELSAAIAYQNMAELTTDKSLQCELSSHATVEYNHFNSLISYAHNHSFNAGVTFTMDESVVKGFPSDNEGIINFTQNLEKGAIALYKNGALLARQNNDLETESFLIGLMKIEQEHFDELATWTNKNRSLNESKKEILSRL